MRYTFQCARNCPEFVLDSREAGWQGDDPRCITCGDRGCTVIDQGPAAAPSTFVLKDSGKREDFSTGARRDTQDGKGDFSRLPYTWLLELAREMQRRAEPHDRLDLIPPSPLLRLAATYGRGCFKYDEDPSPENPAPKPNYQKGIPLSRCVSSLQRHLIAYAEGDQSEDHLAQAAWNAFAMIFMDEAVRAGRLPRSIGDYGPLVEPDATLITTSGLSHEPGGAPIVPIRQGTRVCVLEGKDVLPDGRTGYWLVVARRNGAVVKGWVRADHVVLDANEVLPGNGQS